MATNTGSAPRGRGPATPANLRQDIRSWLYELKGLDGEFRAAAEEAAERRAKDKEGSAPKA